MYLLNVRFRCIIVTSGGIYLLYTWTERAADAGEKNLVCGLALGKACSGNAQCEPLLALTGGARVSVGTPGCSVFIDLTTVLTVGGGRHQDNRERWRWRERRGHWNRQVSCSSTIWKYKKQRHYINFCLQWKLFWIVTKRGGDPYLDRWGSKCRGDTEGFHTPRSSFGTHREPLRRHRSRWCRGRRCESSSLLLRASVRPPRTGERPAGEQQ